MGHNRCERVRALVLYGRSRHHLHWHRRCAHTAAERQRRCARTYETYGRLRQRRRAGCLVCRFGHCEWAAAWAATRYPHARRQLKREHTVRQRSRRRHSAFQGWRRKLAAHHRYQQRCSRSLCTPGRPRHCCRGVRCWPLHQSRRRSNVDHRTRRPARTVLLCGSVLGRCHPCLRVGRSLRGAGKNLSTADPAGRRRRRHSGRRRRPADMDRRYRGHRLHRRQRLVHCGG